MKKAKIVLPVLLIVFFFAACKKELQKPDASTSAKLSKLSLNSTSTDIWEQLPGTATDIGVGANGAVFITDTTTVSATGGFGIWQWNGSSWTVMPNAAAVRVAVDPYGTPWVVNKSHLIFKYNGSYWDQLPGVATDIGIGADGSVFITDTTTVSSTGGFRILKWNGSSWNIMPNAAAVRVAVDANGTPWVVNKSNLVFQYNGSYWNQLPGTATDIGIGADNSVYITGTTVVSSTGGFRISKWDGTGWADTAEGAGINISVDPNGHPWTVNASHLIFRNLNL